MVSRLANNEMGQTQAELGPYTTEVATEKHRVSTTSRSNVWGNTDVEEERGSAQLALSERNENCPGMRSECGTQKGTVHVIITTSSEGKWYWKRELNPYLQTR